MFEKFNHPQFWLFCFILIGLLLSISGHGTFVDENLMIQSVESLVERGEFTVFNMYQALLGPDGNYYSRYGVGFSLLLAPFYLIGKTLPPHPMFMGNPNMFVMLLGNVFFTALMGLFFFRLARLVGGSQHHAALLTVLLVFATPFLPYTQTLFRQNISILVLLLIFWCILIYERKNHVKYLLSLSALTAFAANLREDLIIAVGFLTIYAVMFGDSQNRVNRLISILMGGLLGIVIWCGHNYVRFGQLYIENYSDISFDYELIISVPGLLWGQRTGILLYAPIILLFPFSLNAAKHAKCLNIWLLGLLIFLSYLFLYAKSNMWFAGICYGPRYLYYLTPFLLLPTVLLLDKHPTWLMKGIVAFLGCWGLIFNSPGVYAHQGKHSSFFNRPDFFELLQRPIQHPVYNTEMDIDLWWIRMMKLDPFSIWPILFTALFALWVLFGYKLFVSMTYHQED